MNDLGWHRTWSSPGISDLDLPALVLTSPDPFPSIVSLPLLNAAVGEAQKNIQAPKALIFSTALAAIALAIQGLFDLRKPSGQTVPLSLMLLTIANSGERKSTAEKAFFSQIHTVQAEQNIIYKENINKWKVELKIWEVKSKSLLKLIKAKSDKFESSDDEERRYRELESVKPVKPKQFKMIYEHATSEALFQGLYQDLPTAGMISSEGGGVLKGAAFNDLPKQNSLWSGDSITVDRVSTESYVLDNARLTISLMIQQSAFQKYIEQHGEQSRGSGLWARFLVCHPASTQGSRTIGDEVYFSGHGNKFAERLNVILQSNIVLLTSAKQERKIIKFSLKASELWCKIFNYIELEIQPGKRFYGAGDHASKLADNIARVAALFHHFEGFDGDISQDTVEVAIDVCLYYSNEFMKIFMPVPQVEKDAEELYIWLQREDKKFGSLNVNYVRQRGPNKLRSKVRLDHALNRLNEQGKIKLGWQNNTKVIYFNDDRLRPNPISTTST